MIEQKQKFSLEEIGALTGNSRRTVRFYIQRGLIDRPEGTSKRASFYTQRHLEQLLTISKWQRAGVSLERIQEIMLEENKGELIPPPKSKKQGDIEIWNRLIIDSGVELHLDPAQSDLSPEQLRAFFREVIELFKRVKNDNH